MTSNILLPFAGIARNKEIHRAGIRCNGKKWFFTSMWKGRRIWPGLNGRWGWAFIRSGGFIFRSMLINHTGSTISAFEYLHTCKWIFRLYPAEQVATGAGIKSGKILLTRYYPHNNPMLIVYSRVIHHVKNVVIKILTLSDVRIFSVCRYCSPLWRHRNTCRIWLDVNFMIRRSIR